MELFGPADAVGRTFSVFIAERLGWDLGQAAFAVSPRRVFHGEMHLDEAAQNAWAARVVTTPVGENAHREAMARRNLVSFTAIQLSRRSPERSQAGVAHRRHRIA